VNQLLNLTDRTWHIFLLWRLKSVAIVTAQLEADWADE